MDGWFLAVCGDYKNNSIECRLSKKYHYFEEDASLCGKYSMVTDYFDLGIDSGEIASNPQFACKKCYLKWKRIFNI